MSERFSEYMSQEAIGHKGMSACLLIPETKARPYTEKEREGFMEWLSDVNYRADHTANSSNILKDSGDWMINREKEFASWKENGTMLWLRGIGQWLLVLSTSFIPLTASTAGAGKTKLTHVIQF
jgi:hypothetical protein